MSRRPPISQSQNSSSNLPRPGFRSVSSSNLPRPPSRQHLPASASSSLASRPPSPNRKPGRLTPSAYDETPEPSLAPSTPPERRLRALANGGQAGRVGNANGKDGKESHIQVVVRCRVRSPQEIRENSPVVVSTFGTRGNQVTLQMSESAPVIAALPSSTNSDLPSVPPTPHASASKKYTFDHVFGPEADQGMLFDDVVRPILSEVLSGYNCTIFAYGQTGTGKTYTMEGDLTATQGTFAFEAGIIPRTLYKLFHTLDSERAEYSVRVSFVELYNEELRDLNAAEGTTSSGGQASTASAATTGVPGGLKIYDDSNKKGVVIQGLEETLIATAGEGLKVLTKGSQRRQIASTKCNDQSSRSHSVFSITVHIKETTSKGEDLLKVGKLNLVDLAGSENIGRSGARDGRAREAGMINQSLLTLGRVINALVERSSHVPYRESKLTRLLQDSLGGRTKTCIIATISPARVNLEETLSTLDYALRAKTIRNKPEVNQRMTKNALLNQYALEIERLKQDLLAAREKNGIYLAKERYDELQTELETRRSQTEEARRLAEVTESQLRTVREQFEQNMRLLGIKDEEMESIRKELIEKESRLREVQEELGGVKMELDGERLLREGFEKSREGWKGWAKAAYGDTEGLRAKIARKAAIETSNKAVITDAKTSFDSLAQRLGSQLEDCNSSQEEFWTRMYDRLWEFREKSEQTLSTDESTLKTSLDLLEQQAVELSRKFQTSSNLEKNLQAVFQNAKRDLIRVTENDLARVKNEGSRHTETMIEEFGGILHESFNAMNEMLGRIGATVQLAHSFLTEEGQREQARRANEQEALRAENARLVEQNRLLNLHIESQQNATSLFKTQLLSMVTNSVDQFVATAVEQTKVDVGRVQSELASGHEERDRIHRAREQEYAEAQERVGKLRTRLDEDKVALEDFRETKRLRMDESVQRVSGLGQTRQATIGKMIIDHSATVSKIADSLGDGCSTIIDRASATQSDTANAVEKLVSDSKGTFGSLKENLSSYKSNLLVTVDDALEDAVEEEGLFCAFVQESKTNLSDLTNNMQQYLGSDIKVDLPTGATPRKRQWPEAGEVLDGDRGKVIEILRKAREGTIPAFAVRPPPSDFDVSSEGSTTPQQKVSGGDQSTPHASVPALSSEASTTLQQMVSEEDQSTPHAPVPPPSTWIHPESSDGSGSDGSPEVDAEKLISPSSSTASTASILAEKSVNVPVRELRYKTRSAEQAKRRPA